MTKKAARKELRLEYVGPAPPGKHRVATHVFVDGPAGRVQVPVGGEFVVPADQVEAYRAARLPNGYRWVGHVRAVRDLGDDTPDPPDDANTITAVADPATTADPAGAPAAAPPTDASIATAPVKAAEEDHADG